MKNNSVFFLFLSSFFKTCESLFREICQNLLTAKVSSREMQKFRGQAEPRKFLPAKVSSFKVVRQYSMNMYDHFMLEKSKFESFTEN